VLATAGGESGGRTRLFVHLVELRWPPEIGFFHFIDDPRPALPIFRLPELKTG
jgi:hypothetical protein